MERFSLDIEKTIDRYSKQGDKLEAIIAFQYPIYCIHTTVKDSSPDVVYKIDLTILRLIKAIPQIKLDELPKLLNLSKDTIAERLESLIKEAFLENERQYFTLTELGKEYIIAGKAERYRYRSYDFFINGRTLKPLKKVFYKRLRNKLISENLFLFRTLDNGKEIEERPFNSKLVFTPICKNSIVEEIMRIDLEDREEYAIPIGCEAIENVNYTQLSIPLMIGLFKDSKGEVYKEVMNGYTIDGNNQDVIDLATGMEDIIQKSLIQVHVNEKRCFLQNNMNEIDRDDEAKNKLFSVSKTDLIALLKDKRRLVFNDDEVIQNIRNGIFIEINKNTLENNKNESRRIIENLKRGRDYILQSHVSNGVWLMLVNYEYSDEFIKCLVEMSNEIQTSRESKKLQSLIEKYSKKPLNIKQLILLQEYDLLEQINIKKHMTEFK